MLARIMAAAVVVLSPHFDDAVLSCWSVLTRSGGVVVVNIFTGVPPGAALHEGELLTGARDAVERARERADEDRAALALAAARPRNLDLPEDLHAAGVRRLARLWRRDARLREVMDATVPHLEEGSHIYVPAALGSHPDHVLVRELGCRLAREGARVSFYADQPYCYAYGWPHWVTGDPPDRFLDVDREWRRYLDGASIGFDELSIEVVPLGDAHEHKLRALRLYRSQFAVLEGGANRRVSNPALTGWEVFWHAGDGHPVDPAGRRRERRR
jgi:LmbE family N-acetylglucosaminyl deacetylase